MENRKYEFINPYNFVELPETNKVDTNNDEKKDNEKKLSGKIEYRLTTKTPLFIPNTSNASNYENDEKKEFEFYSYRNLDNKINLCDNTNLEMPVIPGSSIRGSIRSIYETMTDSCLSKIDEPEFLSRRTPEIFKPGIIVRVNNNKYELYTATEYSYKEGIKKIYKSDKFGIKDGRIVYCNCRDKLKISSKELTDCKEKCYIIKGEAGPEIEVDDENRKRKRAQLEKHCIHILKKKQDCVKNIDLNINNLEDCIKKYQKENGENYYGEYYDTLCDFKKGNIKEIPVYYSIIQNTNLVYLSPAKITREIYYNKIKKIVSKNCNCGKNTLCPACKLFGTISEKYSKSSGIRFSDLLPVKKADDNREYYNNTITLGALSSPKIQTTEFYLKKPKCKKGRVVFWTYDYYVYLDRNDKAHVESYMPKIAGRKFYWHSEIAYEKLNKKYEKNETNDKFSTVLNDSIRPVKKGIEFKGTLYFDKIDENELNQIIWLLNMSDDKVIKNGNRNMRYAVKLGRGKPLGLGSCALEIDSISIRKFDGTKYEIIEYDKTDIPSDTELFSNLAVEKFLDFDAIKGLNVDYPRLSMGGESFEWFENNRIGYKKFPNKRNDLRVNYSMVSGIPDLKENDWKNKIEKANNHYKK